MQISRGAILSNAVRHYATDHMAHSMGLLGRVCLLESKEKLNKS